MSGKRRGTGYCVWETGWVGGGARESGSGFYGARIRAQGARRKDDDDRSCKMQESDVKELQYEYSRREGGARLELSRKREKGKRKR